MLKPKLIIIPNNSQLKTNNEKILKVLYNHDIQSYLICNNPELSLVFNKISPNSFAGVPKPPYVSLIGAIIGQIIRYTQAKMIRGNLYRMVGDNFTISNISKLTTTQWSTIGLSQEKTDIIIRTNNYIIENNLDVNNISHIYQLKNVMGIGEWTIITTILTSFMDWDVFPCGDLFIRKKLQKLYCLNKVPTISETRKISENYKPYRSVVAWFLWRWFD